MDFNIINITSKQELLNALSANQQNNFRIGAGYTDLIPELQQNSPDDLTIINITHLKDREFAAIQASNDVFTLGTLVTATDLIENTDIRTHFPVLYEAAASVASTQIRNSATIGGNICNASPSADMSAALVALKARCHIINDQGDERIQPLVDLIQGVRKTSLAKNEVLKCVAIPKNKYPEIFSGFIKVGTRNSMEIAIVSLSYHLQCHFDGIIAHAGISIGAVSPVIPFCEEACQYLLGRKCNEMTDEDGETFAKIVLKYAAPISDIRASEWYRKEVLLNISKSMFNLKQSK